jgi:hypothetical protein
VDRHHTGVNEHSTLNYAVLNVVLSRSWAEGGSEAKSLTDRLIAFVVVIRLVRRLR